MAQVQSPWVHFEAILGGPATTQGTDKLLSSSKGDRISSLLLPVPFRGMASMFPAHAAHPQGTQVKKTEKLCFDPTTENSTETWKHQGPDYFLE